MKLERVVKTEADRENVINWIKAMPIDKPHECIIKPYSNTLSRRQQKLYFDWVRIFVPEMAADIDEMHSLLKERFLVSILRREVESYGAMIDAIIACRVHNPEQADTLKKAIIELTSIRDGGLVTTKIMSEFMDKVYRFGVEFNYRLPRPGGE